MEEFQESEDEATDGNRRKDCMVHDLMGVGLEPNQGAPGLLHWVTGKLMESC